MIVDTPKLTITSKYGPRWNSFHRGIDLRTVDMTTYYDLDIIAPEKCRVKRVGVDGYKNYFLVVEPMENRQFKELKFIHIDDYAFVLFFPGMILSKNEYIGHCIIGGNSTEKHLHFEGWIEVNGKLTHTNPEDYLRVIKRLYSF